MSRGRGTQRALSREEFDITEFTAVPRDFTAQLLRAETKKEHLGSVYRYPSLFTFLS